MDNHKITSLFILFFAWIGFVDADISEFMKPKMHSQSVLSSSSGASLTLYHTNGFDSSGIIIPQIIFESDRKDLKIMSSSNWIRFNLKYEINKVFLKSIVKKSRNYKTEHKSDAVFFGKPSEAWLKEESRFKNSHYDYKTETKFANIIGLNGVKYYCLEVKVFRSSIYSYTLYFAKGIGLLKYKDANGYELNNNLAYESLALTFSKSSNSSEALRKRYYSLYKSTTAIGRDTNNIANPNSLRTSNFRNSLDSLTALAMALSEKNSSLTSYTKFLLVGAISFEVSRFKTLRPRDPILNQYMEDYAHWALFLAPKISSLSTTTAKKYLKSPVSSFKQNYFAVLNGAISSRFDLISPIYSNYSQVDANDVIGYTEQYLRTGLSKKAATNENVYNQGAYAYSKIGNKEKDFYYNVLAAEQFLTLSDEEKALNVKYVESFTKELMRKTTSNEMHYTKAIEILAMYKIKGKALEKARSGFLENKFNSKSFLFAYGDIALSDKNRANLELAVEALEEKDIEKFTIEEKKRLLKYYQFLGSVEKASHLEKSLNKDIKKKNTRSKRSSRGGGFPIGLAVSTNPANLLWNTFPLAADLRIGGTIHQFRVNSHNERTSGSLFGNYSIMQEVDDNLRKDWIITSGRDYSYGLLFRTTDDMVIGPVLGYGNLKLSSDFARVKDEVGSSTQIVALDPKVTRFSGVLQWGWRFASRRQHYYFGMYYLAGIGYRKIDYGYIGSLNISSKDQYSFEEDASSFGYRHSNWNKFYGIFNMHMRIGITLF